MANRVGVSGSRNGHEWVEETLTNSHAVEPIDQLILGCAVGVDRQALEWALANNVFFVVWTADWTAHGKRAGMARNAKMVACARPDARFVGFPQPGSIGTFGCLNLSRKAGLYTYWVDPHTGVLKSW